MGACMRSDIVVNRTSSGIGRAITLRLATAEHHIYAGVRRPVDAPKSPPASSPPCCWMAASCPDLARSCLSFPIRQHVTNQTDSQNAEPCHISSPCAVHLGRRAQYSSRLVS
jgi:NAD(P)-dependent dehydrogenase (short-subunit alcohol dehydrogenase family)